MSTVIEAKSLTKTFGAFTAVDSVDFAIEENKIYGLLGRNGAGKTTIMQLLTGQDFATSGSVSVYGQSPVENARVLSNVSFIKESQKYPDSIKAKHVLAAAPSFYGNWNAELAAELTTTFRVPLNRDMRKLSRGQLSAVGVIVGLASRAPITFFDEPYLGLDAVARQLFYDKLLEDYAEYPRTIILSTHLIDEVSDLLEHVILIEEGKIVLDTDAEELRGRATTVVGRSADVAAFVEGREVIHRDGIGGLSSVTVLGGLSSADRAAATAASLELAPVSLQQLIVRLSSLETTKEGSNS